MGYLQNLQFALSVTLPVFLVLAVGWWLRRIDWIDERFTETGSRLVFNLALPALIFTSLIDLDLGATINIAQVLYALAATLAGFCLLWWLSGIWPGPGNQRGVVVQGAFRGNLGIVGIAICASLYGREGLAVGSVLLAVMTLAYNLLSVFALTAASREKTRWQKVLVAIAKNPLILSILAGLSVAALEIPLPALVITSAEYFGQMTLPLALLCVGATLSLNDLRYGSAPAFAAVGLKLIILPAAFILAALPLGLEDTEMGTLFAMFSAPTATVSYIMVRSLGGDHRLAASIVAISTLLAPVSISTGLYVLRTVSLI